MRSKLTTAGQETSNDALLDVHGEKIQVCQVVEPSLDPSNVTLSTSDKEQDLNILIRKLHQQSPVFEKQHAPMNFFDLAKEDKYGLNDLPSSL